MFSYLSVLKVIVNPAEIVAAGWVAVPAVREREVVHLVRPAVVVV